MSFDAVTWAGAQRMPFDSAPVRARAKAVLKTFAAYANPRGRTWCAMSVLTVETDLPDRTVQRGISDLKACGLLEETGDKELFAGKLYPIYRLPLENGPQNIRDRLREDRGGVTSVSPQAAADDVCGDTQVTPSDDTGDALGVTRETPKQTLILPITGESSNAHSGAREAAARLVELERIAPKSILRFYDQQLALAALQQLLAEGCEGVDFDDLPAALGRMAGHPDFRTRKHPPQLHDWLRKRQFLGWLGDGEAPSDAEGAAAEARTAFAPFAGPAELLAQLGDGAATLLVGARWRGEDRTILTRTGWAANEIVNRIGRPRLAELELRVERAPAVTHQSESGNERHAG